MARGGHCVPTAEEYNNTMHSALHAMLESIHEIPYGCVLSKRDKRGQWGKANGWWAYCHRCCEWLEYPAVIKHKDCSGPHWDTGLGKAEWDWHWQLQEIRDRVNNGRHPFFEEIHDRRNGEPVAGSVFPAFVAGEQQLLRAPPAPGLDVQLELMLDIPSLDSIGDKPLNVLVYFHGAGGENVSEGPRSMPGLAVLAFRCPTYYLGDKRCWWFTTGKGNDWEMHHHEGLTRIDAMLTAVDTLIDDVLAGLELVGFRHGVRKEIMLLGVSMGGRGALEFARTFPSRICGAIVIAGLYDPSQLVDLVPAIAEVPLLLIHSRQDAACPFETIDELYRLRTSGNDNDSVDDSRRVRPRLSAKTEAWFASGWQHTPRDEERAEAITWAFKYLIDNV